jgi:hypothetical protein
LNPGSNAKEEELVDTYCVLAEEDPIRVDPHGPNEVPVCNYSDLDNILCKIGPKSSKLEGWSFCILTFR